MHLFKFLWQKRNNIAIFVLSLIFCGFATYPLLANGVNGAFFSIDPDIVYTANALSYIKYNIIGYYDHPGIPSIYVLAQSLIPFRIYSKFILKQSFLDFVFNNYDFMIFYLRLFQSLLFFIGLNIFLRGVYKFTNKFVMVLIAFLMLLNYSPILNIGLSISAESLNFTLISIWLYCMILYLKNNKPIVLNFILLLTGILMANRTTNFFYLIAALIMILIQRKLIIKRLVFIVLGFLIGVFPVIDNFKWILKRMFFFAGSSGIHGNGAGKIFDLNSYIYSLKTFWDRDLIFSISVILIAVLILIYKKKLKPLLFYLSITTIVITLAFAKFPLQHYQIPNFLFLVVMFTLFIKDTKLTLVLLAITLLTYFAIPNITNYKRILLNEIEKTVALENFVKINPSVKGELWEWARSKNFSYLWTNSYGAQVFENNLRNNNINMYSGESTLFNRCWDNLYIQKSSYESTMLNLNKQLIVTYIPNSQDILLIKSDHCTMLKP